MDCTRRLDHKTDRADKTAEPHGALGSFKNLYDNACISSLSTAPVNISPPSQQYPVEKMSKAETSGSDDPTSEIKHVEDTSKSATANLVYEIDEEPELHAHTWFALAAMCLLNMVQVLGLLSPPSAVCEPSVTSMIFYTEELSFHSSRPISTTRLRELGCPTPFPSCRPYLLLSSRRCPIPSRRAS
jgi:hypothetical protein